MLHGEHGCKNSARAVDPGPVGRVNGAGRVRVQRGWLAEEVLLTLKLVGPSAVTLYRYS